MNLLTSRQRSLNGLKSIQLCIGLSVALASVSLYPAAAQSDQPQLRAKYAQWESSYADAMEQSNRTGRPIMLVFTGSDWCPWCNRLTQEVFLTHAFSRWSTDNVIKVEVDFPQTYKLPANILAQNQNLKTQFGQHVQSYPTVLFVDSNEKILGKTGYVSGGAGAWIETAKSVIPIPVRKDLLARSK